MTVVVFFYRDCERFSYSVIASEARQKREPPYLCGSFYEHGAKRSNLLSAYKKDCFVTPFLSGDGGVCLFTHLSGDDKGLPTYYGAIIPNDKSEKEQRHSRSRAVALYKTISFNLRPSSLTSALQETPALSLGILRQGL